MRNADCILHQEVRETGTIDEYDLLYGASKLDRLTLRQAGGKGVVARLRASRHLAIILMAWLATPFYE